VIGCVPLMIDGRVAQLHARQLGGAIRARNSTDVTSLSRCTPLRAPQSGKDYIQVNLRISWRMLSSLDINWLILK